MRHIWLFLALASGVASANPIAVESIQFYKEGAVVTITVDREQSKIEGTFRYRGELPKASDGVHPVMFGLRVPVFVPKEGYGPASQKDMWSSYSNPQRSLSVAIQLQYAIVNPQSQRTPYQTIRNCRAHGARDLPITLPQTLLSSVDIVECDERILMNGGTADVSLSLDYLQYHARAKGSSRMSLIYVPLFETRDGSQIDTTGRPDDYQIEVRAASGVSLRLKSANKAITKTDTLLRLVPVHGEPIIVEVH